MKKRNEENGQSTLCHSKTDHFWYKKVCHRITFTSHITIISRNIHYKPYCKTWYLILLMQWTLRQIQYNGKPEKQFRIALQKNNLKRCLS